MFMKNKGGAPRAWSILRLVLLWARKGGLFRQRLVIDHPLRCTERELSFEKAPIVHVKIHRPHSVLFGMPRLPCINPRTDYDFDCEDYSNKYREGNAGYCDAERIGCMENNFEGGSTPRVPYEVEAVEGIDFKAEEIIAKFYQQMKLQRHVFIQNITRRKIEAALKIEGEFQSLMFTVENYVFFPPLYFFGSMLYCIL